jgi:hypothetical protein
VVLVSTSKRCFSSPVVPVVWAGRLELWSSGSHTSHDHAQHPTVICACGERTIEAISL